MRITFVLPFADLAGGIKVVAVYAERLMKRGHQVLVVSLPPRRHTLKNKIKTIIKSRSWPCKLAQLSYMDGFSFEHRVLEKYRPLVDTDVPDADVIIATWWETAEWVNDLHPSKGKKIYFVQGHEVFDHLPIERVKATYRMPFRHIAISQWLINTLRDGYGAKDTHLVPNSVDYNFFNATLRSRQQELTIGCIYSTLSIKGCDLSLTALRQVKKILPNFQALSFGFQHPSKELPLPRNTKFFFQPTQEKIVALYSSCDFWLFSSRSEGFGLPILESMACRTPVIATRAGAAPELICKGGGVLLNGWSAEEISQTILDLNELDNKDWQAMSNRARDTVTGYSWDDATILFERALTF